MPVTDAIHFFVRRDNHGSSSFPGFDPVRSAHELASVEE
jgi:hypothetical protein